MATIVILKKDGSELKFKVLETAEAINNLLNNNIVVDSFDDRIYDRFIKTKPYINSIVLTKPDGRQIGFNIRLIAYYFDE